MKRRFILLSLVGIFYVYLFTYLFLLSSLISKVFYILDFMVRILNLISKGDSNTLTIIEAEIKDEIFGQIWTHTIKLKH